MEVEGVLPTLDLKSWWPAWYGIYPADKDVIFYIYICICMYMSMAYLLVNEDSCSVVSFSSWPWRTRMLCMARLKGQRMLGILHLMQQNPR